MANSINALLYICTLTSHSTHVNSCCYQSMHYKTSIEIKIKKQWFCIISDSDHNTRNTPNMATITGRADHVVSV